MENFGGGGHGKQQKQDGTGGLPGAGAGAQENIKDKIMDKLPGGHTGAGATGTHGMHGSGATGGLTGGGGQENIKDKIMDKFPGGQKQGQQGYNTSTTTPGTGGGFGASGGYGEQTHEKKGMMENIKDKLPGGTGQHRV